MALNSFARQGVPGPHTGTNDRPGLTRVVTDANGNEQWQIRLYNSTASALVVGRPYVVTFTGVDTTTPQVITPAAVATVNREVVVAAEAVAATSFGWFVYHGVVKAMLNGSPDIAISGWLKLAPGTSTTAFILDDATNRSNSSVAIARVAYTPDTDGLAEVYLLGDKAVVNT